MGIDPGWGAGMSELLFGAETEYAVAGIYRKGKVEQGEVLFSLMSLAGRRLVHLRDLNSFGGIFIQNGSRFYTDCGGHPEICTPECMSPTDLVRYVEANHRIVGGLAGETEVQGKPGVEVLVFRCNVDYSGTSSTWGMHESYLHKCPQDSLRPELIPHLVTRILYTGAGGFNPNSTGLEFTLSPRMAHFNQVVAGSSTSERGIWHVKSEPLSMGSGYRRLHVICGESLCSQTSSYLKFGATALIVAMADAGLNPGAEVQLADPVAALHAVAGDVTCKKELAIKGGRALTAIAIQRHYLEMAEAHAGDSFMPEWAGELCRRWRDVLDRLESDPASMGETLDWAIKRTLYSNHALGAGLKWNQLPFMNQVISELETELANRSAGRKAIPLGRALRPRSKLMKEIAWMEPMLRAQGLDWNDLRKLERCRQQFFEIDMRFGQLGPKGIFERLDSGGMLKHRIAEPEEIEQAMTEPPAGGRAHLRGKAIARLASGLTARCDWQSVVDFDAKLMMDLNDPFMGEEKWEELKAIERRRASMPPELTDLLGLDGPFADTPERPYSRRVRAYECYQRGEYGQAVELLEGCVADHFELASNHIHLARSLLMLDRDAEAREHVTLAWEAREGSLSYVTPRIAFCQLMFAMLDGAECTEEMRRMKEAVSRPGVDSEWNTGGMLDHMRARLGEENFRLLKALAAAMSNWSQRGPLEAMARWREAGTPSEGVSQQTV